MQRKSEKGSLCRDNTLRVCDYARRELAAVEQLLQIVLFGQEEQVRDDRLQIVLDGLLVYVGVVVFAGFDGAAVKPNLRVASGGDDDDAQRCRRTQEQQECLLDRRAYAFALGGFALFGHYRSPPAVSLGCSASHRNLLQCRR